MKVVLIYRKPQTGAYSIEELFHTIAGELDKYAEVIEYETGSRRNILSDVWHLRKLNADIYHVTGDINYLVPLLPKKKTVLTIHDIGHYLYGLRGVKRFIYKYLWLSFPIRSADAVTTVSLETYKNITKHLGFPEKNIEMIENCYSATFKPAPKKCNSEYPVVLQVGTRPYKNVPRLIEALRELHCKLVLIGNLDGEIKQKLADYGVAYENQLGLSHEELYKRYIECDVVSFASLGEGFGVPIIEAQAVGRPVITSDLSPMKDVAGDAACLVNPLRVSEIREAIQKLFFDDIYRNQLIENGFKNVRRYSPTTISAKYLEVYKRLILT